MKNDGVIIMRIPTGLKAAAQEKAQSDARTLTSYIQALIIRDLGPAAKAALARPKPD